jgi:hypothetical protein
MVTMLGNTLHYSELHTELSSAAVSTNHRLRCARARACVCVCVCVCVFYYGHAPCGYGPLRCASYVHSVIIHLLQFRSQP